MVSDTQWGWLTGSGLAGVQVFRVAGVGAEVLVRHALASNGTRPRFAVGGVRFGRLRDGEEVLDEALVLCPEAGVFDVCTHGGLGVRSAITRWLERVVGPPTDARSLVSIGEPTQFDHEWSDAVGNARAQEAAWFLLRQGDGRWKREVERLVRLLRGNLRAVEVATQRLDAWAERAPFGIALASPPGLAIIGAPNAGKSTLANRLLRQERSLVSEEPGTTRDVIASDVVMDGWPFRLLDTAGLRDTADPVEEEGVKRARAAAVSSPLRMLVVDGTQGVLPVGIDPRPGDLWVWTKQDHPEYVPPRDNASDGSVPVQVSGLTGFGLDALRARVVDRSPFGRRPADGPCPFTARQVAWIERARAALPDDPEAAVDALVRGFEELP